MPTITYETETAIFQFDRTNVMNHLKKQVSESPIDDVIKLIDFITTTPDETIKIPDEYDYFGYIVLTLIEGNKGSITCKTCNETYEPDQLKPTIVGHGTSPFTNNIKRKGGIMKRFFGKKKKRMGRFGGKGYECLKGHELISMKTWVT
jgi:hypothetical protein